MTVWQSAAMAACHNGRPPGRAYTPWASAMADVSACGGPRLKILGLLLTAMWHNPMVPNELQEIRFEAETYTLRYCASSATVTLRYFDSSPELAS